MLSQERVDLCPERPLEDPICVSEVSHHLCRRVHPSGDQLLRLLQNTLRPLSARLLCAALAALGRCVVAPDLALGPHA
eukprot:5338801-Alexandrium_andersonii.AAC.1